MINMRKIGLVLILFLINLLIVSTLSSIWFWGMSLLFGWETELPKFQEYFLNISFYLTYLLAWFFSVKLFLFLQNKNGQNKLNKLLVILLCGSAIVMFHFRWDFETAAWNYKYALIDKKYNIGANIERENIELPRLGASQVPIYHYVVNVTNNTDFDISSNIIVTPGSYGDTSKDEFFDFSYDQPIAHVLHPGNNFIEGNYKLSRESTLTDPPSNFKIPVNVKIYNEEIGFSKNFVFNSALAEWIEVFSL